MRFAAGQRVRVAERSHEGHHRTPRYLKGMTGVIQRGHGRFTNPEARAYGADGRPELDVYLVGFAQRDVWPGYEGDPGDRIDVDVFEHWLEEVE